MGHWGTAILSNDTSADIKDTFFDLYDKGQIIPDIRKEIEKQFKDNDNLRDNTDFWLTLALLQWQVGALDKDVKEFVEQIIDNDIDLDVWKESDADDKSLAKRKTELLKFRDKLQTPNPKPRKVKIKKMPTALFKKGEVFAFPLSNGLYSAVIIFEEILSLDYHYTVVACCDINKSSIPTIEEVIKSNVLVLPPRQNEKAKFTLLIRGCSPTKSKEIRQTFIKVGDLTVKEDYTGNFINLTFSGWQLLVDTANMYLVDKKTRPNEIVPVTNYVKTGGNWFKKLFGK